MPELTMEKVLQPSLLPLTHETGASCALRCSKTPLRCTLQRYSSLLRIVLTAVACAVALSFVFQPLRLANFSAGPVVREGYQPVTPNLGLQPWLAKSLGQLSPWFAAAPYTAPPAGCVIDQVHILQRHGARYPTDRSYDATFKVYQRLKNVEAYLDPRLNFIKSWDWTLGKDLLVPFGAAQSFDAGQAAYVRYGGLVSAEDEPFVRASGQERVINSANAWSAGFALASTGSSNPALAVVIPEGTWTVKHPMNNTLNDQMCPNADRRTKTVWTWGGIFGQPIVDRVNRDAPGANLELGDLPNLISLCAFDSVAKEAASPWCGLFSEKEYAGFEYLRDLGTYYTNGYGNELGRVQGVGYVNELLARLTETPVSDATQTNGTLDSDPETFPLGRAFYADFTHDNQMQSIYAALGVFRPARDLDPKDSASAGPWRVAALTPFSARMVTERLACGAGGVRAAGTYVRVVVNDAVQPLEFCDGAADGVCELGKFVESQAYARGEYADDWAKCLPPKAKS